MMCFNLSYVTFYVFKNRIRIYKYLFNFEISYTTSEKRWWVEDGCEDAKNVCCQMLVLTLFPPYNALLKVTLSQPLFTSSSYPSQDEKHDI